MLRARFRVTAALACTFVLVTSAVEAPSLRARQLATTQQRPRFESTVSRVRVNVIVTDREGRFVDDLRAEDFAVFEDGERHEVLELQLIDLAAGEVRSLLAEAGADDPGAGGPPGSAFGRPAAGAVATVAPPAAGDAPSAAGVPPPASDANQVAATYGAIIFLIDFKGIDHTTKLHFTNQWDRYLDTRDATAVPQAVYLIDQVGRLQEILPLTGDMDRVRAAQQTIEGTPLTRASVLPEGPEALASFEEHDRSVYSLRLLRHFCDALATRPGRTALVWVSPGVTLKGPMPSDSRGLPRLPASRYEPQARILRLQRELHAAANSANVSIYAVDPSRLIDVLGISNPRQELGNSLRHAAAETGGKHFIAWADFGEVVEEIQQDSGRYYLLSYPGPVPGGDGRYHEIRVEVNRPGVSIRSKEGYIDYSEEERRSRFVSAALMLPGSVNDLSVAAEVFRGAPGGDLTDVMVAVATDGKDLQIGSGDTGEPIQRIEVHGAVLDEDHDMEVVAEMHREVTEALPGAQPAPERWLRSKGEWTLRAGHYDLRVMVLDTVSGRIGTTQVAIEIPKVDGDAWSAGDVVLVDTPGGAEPVPIVQGQADAGANVTAFIEVRGGQQPILSGRLRLASTSGPEGSAGRSRGSGAQVASGAEVFAQPMRREGPLHRGSLQLPPLPAGEYVLELHVDDAPAAAEHRVEIPLHVREP
jgi:VWFA-related protein